MDRRLITFYLKGSDTSAEENKALMSEQGQQAQQAPRTEVATREIRSAEVVKQVTTSLFPQQLEHFTGSWLSTVDRVSEMAERRGHSNFLVGLGTAILAVGLVWKLQPLGLEISNIGAVEFITVFAVGTLLVLSGSTIRIMQRRAILETERAKRQLAAPILQTQTQLFREVVEEVVRTQSEMIKAVNEEQRRNPDETSW